MKVSLLNKLSAEQEAEEILTMPRNSRGNVYLPMFDPNDMELKRLQDILKTLFSDTWSKSLFIISNCTKADV